MSIQHCTRHLYLPVCSRICVIWTFLFVVLRTLQIICANGLKRQIQAYTIQHLNVDGVASFNSANNMLSYFCDGVPVVEMLIYSSSQNRLYI